MNLKLYAIIFLSIGISLSACSPTTPIPLNTPPITTNPPGTSATPLSQSPVTPGPAMTDTSVPTAMASETTVPTPAATEIPTPVSSLTAQVIPTLNAYCRKGPDTLYDIVTFIQKGSAYDVVGRDSQSTWWLVKTPGVSPCWVGGSNVSVNGPVEQALIVQGQPLPETPALFESSDVCDTLLKTLGVRLDWSAAQDTTGYRIYRNGVLLTTLDGSLTSYHDDAPLGVDLVYELEAFNEYGVAVRAQTSVPACK